ncbi:MAG TPA: polyisoprenoid-binding protein [Acidimicrobiales bacterium]|nr:polyisoprenoid-binding protein [Acidimicrobiales bacterium]
MSTATRNLPLAPGTWTLDPLHCTVEFTARHMAISKVRGRFHTFDAALVVGNSLETSSLSARVDMASVDTNNADRDAHLRNSDFFHVDQHPEMTFESTAILSAGENTYGVVGDLTINGVTRQERLDVVFHGTETFPGDGSFHAGFEATATISRTDYGIDFNVPLGAGGFVISDNIGIELDIQLRAPHDGDDR